MIIIIGKLIVFEGISSSGKTTQIELLKKKLVDKGQNVVITSWKSDDIIEPIIHEVKSNRLFTPLGWTTLHGTEFASRYFQIILPVLEDGGTVLADRYIPTALVRDTLRGTPYSYVRNLFSFAIDPTIYLYIDISPDVSLKRRLNRHSSLYYHSSGGDLGLSDNLEESFLLYQQLQREKYFNLSNEFNFVIIDGASDKKLVENKIWEAISSVTGW